MVTVTIENNEFKFHGTFDCGYAGLYRDNQIFFYGEPDYIRGEGLQGKDLSACSDEELAAEIAAFYNAAEAHVQAHIQQFNDAFLYKLFDAFEGCGYPFWEYPEMVNPAFLQAHPDFDLEDSYDGEEFSDPVFIPENAGHMEMVQRKEYPMFNFEYYLSHLTLHNISVENDGWISFEISDAMDYLCHLIGVVKPDFSYHDWNNG
ncbi:MAG: hypothetical protein K5695_16405 [Oscillospiraceae bacterium]|nr:hypothetical protein [Oscillospiraceae bacterium]